MLGEIFEKKFIQIVVFFIFAAPISFSEPWLSSRFARNCAGCHAPQRINLPPKGRRCSLSCQGCHVNPNGGGIRSHYGKWNENRWLKSFRIDALAHDLNFEPYPDQPYGKNKTLWKKNKYKKKGMELVETKKKMNEEKYYGIYGQYQKIARNSNEFLYQIPEKDPYRLMNLSKIDGGADARWYTHSKSEKISTNEQDSSTKSKWVNFPMSVDFGLRYRPIYKKIHLVYEGRMYGSPSSDKDIGSFVSNAFLRSAYLNIDDLPYNVFVMGGYYRPLFGNYDPFHNGLPQKMISFTLQNSPRAYSLVYKALSIGTAPNVPYLNIHKIGNRHGSNDENNDGYAINAGMRGVKYGQSLNYSYWTSKDRSKNIEIAMHSIGSFVNLYGVTFSLEGVSLFRDDKSSSSKQGGVITGEVYVKTWRENYIHVSYAQANTTEDLLPGSANQLRIGLKSFIIPGVELATYFENENQKNKESGSSIESSGVSGNLHAYF